MLEVITEADIYVTPNGEDALVAAWTFHVETRWRKNKFYATVRDLMLAGF